MRLGRFTVEDGEHDGTRPRVGVFDGDVVSDVTDTVDSFSDALSRPAGVSTADSREYPVSAISYLPPVTADSTVFCTALNYEAHAEESNIDVPEWPLVFLKLPRTMVGHERPIAYHSDVTNELDYEAELAAVIGSPARHVSPEEALEHVAGYTICNDTSARDLQLGLAVGDDQTLDWFSGKAQESTTPLGPTVVTDEIEDPQDLDIASRVNGEVLQDDNTSRMVRSVADLVSFLSSRVTLRPGDVIATGTPEGVGLFQDITLDHGDTVEVEIEGLGTLRNTVEETA